MTTCSHFTRIQRGEATCPRSHSSMGTYTLGEDITCLTEGAQSWHSCSNGVGQVEGEEG